MKSDIAFTCHNHDVMFIFQCCFTMRIKLLSNDKPTMHVHMGYKWVITPPQYTVAVHNARYQYISQLTSLHSMSLMCMLHYIHLISEHFTTNITRGTLLLYECKEHFGWSIAKICIKIIKISEHMVQGESHCQLLEYWVKGGVHKLCIRITGY